MPNLQPGPQPPTSDRRNGDYGPVRDDVMAELWKVRERAHQGMSVPEIKRSLDDKLSAPERELLGRIARREVEGAHWRLGR